MTCRFATLQRVAQLKAGRECIENPMRGAVAIHRKSSLRGADSACPLNGKYRVRNFKIRASGWLDFETCGLLVLLALSNCGCDRATEQNSAGMPVGINSVVDDTRAQPLPAACSLLRRACAYLWSQQADDGGWHSAHYAVLRSGQAITPFVLHSLLEVPDSTFSPPDGGAARALDFLRKQVDKQGAIGRSDPELLEYPNYATAYALRCFVVADDRRDRPLVARMRAYLIGEQFAEHRGFDSSSPAYGGWGFGGRLADSDTGHMDLAHTRRVVEALRDAGGVDLAVFKRTEAFLRFVQRHPTDDRAQPPHQSTTVSYDGGFYFSPIVTDANKGRIEDQHFGSHFRSYATATCDGLLALMAAGVPRDDERVVAAKCWLGQHPRLDYPAGVPSDHPESWGEAIRFYHLAVRAEVFAELGEPHQHAKWREQFVALLADAQRDDGSFVNTASHLMKDDDPLLCTTLAVIALEHALRSR